MTFLLGSGTDILASESSSAKFKLFAPFFLVTVGQEYVVTGSNTFCTVVGHLLYCCASTPLCWQHFPTCKQKELRGYRVRRGWPRAGMPKLKLYHMCDGRLGSAGRCSRFWSCDFHSWVCQHQSAIARSLCCKLLQGIGKLRGCTAPSSVQKIS